MTSFVMKDTEVYFNEYDITGITNQLACNYSADMQDATVLGLSTRKREPGLLEAGVSLNSFFDGTDTSHKEFFDQIGNATQGVVSFSGNNPAAGERAFLLPVHSASFDFGGAVGELLPFTSEFASHGPLVRGYVANNGNLTTDGNSASFSLGALADTTEEIYASLHVIGSSGSGNQTLDVSVVSDADGTFDSVSQTRISFTQVTTAINSQLKSVAGAITDANWRVEWLVGGTGSPTFDAFIVIGRKAIG